MKSLLSSSSSSCSTKYFHFSYSSSVKFHPHLVSFPIAKLPSLHFISLQPFHLLPLSSSSDSQLELLSETVNHEICENTVRVKFQLKKECSFGEQFAIVGDDPNFGLWDPDNAIPLNWSDDHVWNLELDVPIGKSIHFKFILRQITGSIMWQPGPDRILKTWDTTNTIVVCEDWEDAASQELLEEEEPHSDENVDPSVNSKAKLVAENFNYSDVKKEELVEDVESKLENEPLPSIVVEPVIADTAASSKEKDVSNSNEEPAMNENHQVLKEEYEVESNNEATNFEKSLENNRRTPELEDSETTNVEGNLMIKEGDPVLVPGLPPVPVECSETESTSAFDASVGVNEVKKHILPEKPVNSILFKEKPVSIQFKEKHGSEMIEAFDGIEQKVVASDDSWQISNKFVENDIQWGRRMLQRLLTNLGLL